MDEPHEVRDTLIEGATSASAATAIAALTSVIFAFLTGEFVGTREYLLEMALAFGLLACVLFLGKRLLHHRPREGP